MGIKSSKTRPRSGFVEDLRVRTSPIRLHGYNGSVDIISDSGDINQKCYALENVLKNNHQNGTLRYHEIYIWVKVKFVKPVTLEMLEEFFNKKYFRCFTYFRKNKNTYKKIERTQEIKNILISHINFGNQTKEDIVFSLQIPEEISQVVLTPKDSLCYGVCVDRSKAPQLPDKLFNFYFFNASMNNKHNLQPDFSLEMNAYLGSKRRMKPRLWYPVSYNISRLHSELLYQKETFSE